MHSGRDSQRAPAGGFTQKTCKDTTLFDICPLRPSKNTHTNTTLFDISSFRPCKHALKHCYLRHFAPSTPQKHCYLRHFAPFAPSTKQKHTKPLLFTTRRPFDTTETHKNKATYDTSSLRHHILSLCLSVSLPLCLSVSLSLCLSVSLSLCLSVSLSLCLSVSLSLCLSGSLSLCLSVSLLHTNIRSYVHTYMHT